jgi:MOSC domain-containing protein
MSIHAQPIGFVQELWRYPVKSMQGERLSTALLTERGLLGDRAYAIVDQVTGYVASAKHPRKWRALLQCQARYAETPQPSRPLPPIWIILPNGEQISSAHPHIHQILSDVLGHPVLLVADPSEPRLRETDRTPLDVETTVDVVREEQLGLATPAATFLDVAPLHILTTATLQYLQTLHPSGLFHVRRFRPNLVITGEPTTPTCLEQTWLNQLLSIGNNVQLWAIDPAPRCVVTTLAQADLPSDPEILRTLARNTSSTSITLAPGTAFAGVVGIYAQVVQTGSIVSGDTINAG